MVDIVPAHCSDEHLWFQRSRQSRNAYADWFHWVDPLPDGSAPTNWLSFLGAAPGRGPRRQQYYLHNFLPSQPNLNHANPEVRAALMEVARFWLDRGVDGFRLDAVHTINADTAPYRDNLPNLDFAQGLCPNSNNRFSANCDSAQLNQPAIQQFSEDLRKVADEYEGDRYLMGNPRR